MARERFLFFFQHWSPSGAANITALQDKACQLKGHFNYLCMCVCRHSLSTFFFSGVSAVFA